MGGVTRAIGSIFGFGGRQKVPQYRGPSPEQAAQEARDRAAREAKEVAAANQKNMDAMNKRLEQVRNQKTDYSQGTLGGQKTGLSRGANIAKLKRAKRAGSTQVKLDPSSGSGTPGSSGQVQV